MTFEHKNLLFMVSRCEGDPRAAGGDVQGFLYARYYAAAGHSVTYLTSSYPGAAAVEERRGVRIVRLGDPQFLAVRFWNYYRRHADEFDAVYTEAFGGARVPFLAPLYVRRPLLTAWYQVNEPIFRHQYGRIGSAALSRLERWTARLHRKATILTPSEERRRDVIGLGFDQAQVFAVPPFALESGLLPGPDNRGPAIVWLGKLRRYKCVHHAVEAMPHVLARRPDARLVIAGRRDDDAYERELRTRTRELGIESSVAFRFDISEEEKRNLLAGASVIVLSSPIEGFGIVLLEAAAVGTPAVVSEGVPEEVVAQGQNGIRVPFGEIPALGRALADVLTDSSLWSRISAGAVAKTQLFSSASLEARLGEVLRVALGSSALPRAVAA